MHNDLYYCGRCDTRKPRERFFTRQSGRKKGQPLPICRDCRKKLSLEAYHKRVATPEGRADYNKKVREQNNTMPSKKRRRERHQRFRRDNTNHYYAFTLRASSKSNAKRKHLPHTITPAWIEARLDKGLCEATGLPLLLRSIPEGTKHPQSPTIDRRDNQQGYTEENCQVVCYWYNMAKGPFKETQVRQLLEQAVDNWRRNHS